MNEKIFSAGKIVPARKGSLNGEVLPDRPEYAPGAAPRADQEFRP